MARWSITLAATVGAFLLGLWAAQQVHWSWLARSEADRWVVAAAFATVVATAVLTLSAGWADRDADQPASAPPSPASAAPGTGAGHSGSGDHIEFHGGQYGPTQGKGTQHNHFGREGQ